jgi:Tol biopolymer transport system component
MQWWECGEGNAPPCIDSELVRHWDIVPPRTESSMQDPQWAPDGRHIMYTESDLGERSLWIVDYNYDEPSSSQADLLIDDRQVYQETWSPDGDRIAFKAREPEDGPWHIFVTDLAGNVQQVTGVSNQPDENEGDFSSPTWSPDGSKLAVSRTGAIPNWGIFTVNLNGTGLNQIAGEAVGPRWSPAGDRIAYVNAEHNLCTMNPDGTGKRVLLQDHSGWTWSPTGSHIAYFADLRSEIWVVPEGGGSPGKIFDASHYRDDRLVLDRLSWSQ